MVMEIFFLQYYTYEYVIFHPNHIDLPTKVVFHLNTTHKRNVQD